MTHPFLEHSSNAHLLHIMDVGLRKVPFVFAGYYPLSVFLA